MSIAMRVMSIPSGNGGVTSDVTQSTFQIASIARKKFSKHFELGWKLDFPPGNLLEKLDSDKCNQNEIGDDDKIQVLESVPRQHCQMTNLEIAFILAFRAIT